MEERLNDAIPNEILIKYLIRDNKKILEELGKEKAYNTELEDNLIKERKKSLEIRQVSREVKKEVKKEEKYKLLKDKITSYKNEIKYLRNLRDDLLFKVSKYEEILKENKLL